MTTARRCDRSGWHGNAPGEQLVHFQSSDVESATGSTGESWLGMASRLGRAYPRRVCFRFDTTDPFSWKTNGLELRGENSIPCSNVDAPAETARRVGLAVLQSMIDRTMHLCLVTLHETRIVPGW